MILCLLKNRNCPTVLKLLKQLKAKRQSTTVFSSDGKFMKLETEKNQSEYPWSKFLIPNPHSER